MNGDVLDRHCENHSSRKLLPNCLLHKNGRVNVCTRWAFERVMVNMSCSTLAKGPMNIDKMTDCHLVPKEMCATIYWQPEIVHQCHLKLQSVTFASLSPSLFEA